MLAASAVSLAALAQTTVVEVIPLKYRTAEQVIPVIQPMLAREGTVNGFQNQIIVRTTPANLEEIRRILASVDTMPRRLLITVRQDADSERTRSAAEAAGNVGSGRARVSNSRSVERDRNAQTIQVLEGTSAFIRVGLSVPASSRQVVWSVVGGRVVEQVIDAIEYRDVTTGFNVLPRVTGDRVTLDISRQRDTVNPQTPGAFDVLRVVTTVSGRLGEWLEIGGVGQERQDERTVLLGVSTGSVDDNRRVLLKVEELK